MPTYVNDLRLTELNTGEGSGTWGVTTNTNLELIGESLGYGTQASFASDANSTTTIADGATDPARSMYFKVTSGVSLTATRELTIAPNTVSRVMYIENATSGSQSITIKQGSGGTVTIANGSAAIVYLDGAGATAAVVDANTSLAATKVDATTLAIGGTDVTSTAAELNLVDGSSAGTIVNSKAVIYGASGEVNGTTLQIAGSSITSTAAELNLVDGSSAGTIVNSKAVVYGASGEVNATTLQIGGTSITSTAAEINLLSGVTATTAEINYLDVTTLGTTEASKAVTADANGVVTFDNGISEEYTAVTSTSNATTVNLQDGTNFSHTLTENTTFTFSNPASSGKVSAFTLKIVQDASASGYTVTWPASVDWPSATAPTLTATASAVDYFVFITHDGGTTYYGFTAGQALG
jgi:hypothetical protein